MNDNIGEAAGAVYSALAGNGALSKDQLKTKTKLDAELITMALGWLAREDKINIELTGKKKIEVALK